jgi:hypothetical protein
VACAEHPWRVGGGARGAVACLLKPFSDTALLEALEAALETR